MNLKAENVQASFVYYNCRYHQHSSALGTEEWIISIITNRKSKTSSQNLRRINKEKRLFKIENHIKIVS